MKKSYVILVAFIVVLSCKEPSALEKYMTDKWQTTYIKIKMPTYTNSDSLFIQEDAFKDKNAAVAQSQYFDDGTFKSWYMKSDGDKVGEITGNWSMDGNNLHIDYVFGNNPVAFVYKVDSTAQGFQATSIHDWDFDGKKDDTLFMTAKRLKNIE